ncbi:MAG: ABC-F family ATP-binding cassette domain-containing protein [Ardenticatenales bacterium]|nr:ABC-F family ATP-binding cassette domain-containing protein [Ardenticatenales bacterium]
MTLDLAGGREQQGAGVRRRAQNLADGTVLWRGLNDIIWHNERVGLVGPNGAGKSMLLKQILDVKGFQGRDQGWPKQPHRLLPQEHRPELRPHPAGRNPPDSTAARGGCRLPHKFLFSYDQIRGPIRTLSGGERSRLQLAKLVLSQPNLLLDEPTNNLDITSIEVLEETLNEFEGTVLVISMTATSSTKLSIGSSNSGTATSTYAGGYTDYLAEIGE